MDRTIVVLSNRITHLLISQPTFRKIQKSICKLLLLIEAEVSNPDGQGQTTPKAPSEVPTGEDGGLGPQIPQQGSMASVEEVDGLVEPEKKKKKVKKTKKVKFDDVSYATL